MAINVSAQQYNGGLLPDIIILFTLLNADSITVSSTWELTSVSVRYSQGDGVNTSLSRITVPAC